MINYKEIYKIKNKANCHACNREDYLTSVVIWDETAMGYKWLCDKCLHEMELKDILKLVKDQLGGK